MDRLTNKKFILAPTHFNEKTIYEKVIQTDDGELELSLRETVDFDEKNQPHVSYEVELQAEKGSWTPQSLFQYACDQLKWKNIRRSDTTLGRYTRKAKTLEQLKSLKK